MPASNGGVEEPEVTAEAPDEMLAGMDLAFE